MPSRKLAVRLATAMVAAPVLLAILLLGPALAWYALVSLAVVVASAELFRMTHPGDRVAQGLGVASSLAVSLVVYFFSTDPKILLTLLVTVTICGLLVPLWRLGDVATSSRRMMAGVAGPLYTGALLTTLALLRRDLGTDGPRYVVLALLVAWLADTGGYFCGSLLGKTKLCPAISPNKTRAGLLGAVGGAVGAGLLAHFWFLTSLPLCHALVLSLVAGALGQLGDLVESLLKRSTGVKDSGRIVPGHGGILDRIDALLVVGPVVYLYALWTGAVGG